MNDVLENNCTHTQQLANRLGTLEAKMVDLEDQVESQEVHWPRLEGNKLHTRPQQSVHCDHLRSFLKKHVSVSL